LVGPTLTTARLTLMPFGIGDAEDCLAMRSDPAVTRFVGGVATREDVWARTLRYIGLWAAFGYGYFAARETASGRFVGEIGFADYRRDTMPDFFGTPEAGWVLAGWAQGQGFAAEAVEALLAWGDETLSAPRTVCMVSPDNHPSLRLAAKVGYRAFADTTYKGHPLMLFERARR